MSGIVVLVQTLQISVGEIKLRKGAEPYGVIYRGTGCDNASQSKKNNNSPQVKTVEQLFLRVK